MKNPYQKTIYACFTAYIIQAIVNNFVPLLFLTFQDSYRIPLSQITLLVTLNFALQLLVDLASVGFVDRIGYRASMVLAHALAAAGLALLAILPELLPSPFLGILLSVCVYAVGGGLIEVVVSPVVEACPSAHKEQAMSLLHSFYCWGHVGVVLLSTAFFALFGTAHRVRAGSAGQPVRFPPGTHPGAAGGGPAGHDHRGAGPEQDVLGVPADDAVRRGQRTGGEPVGVHLCGEGPGRGQNGG